MAVRTYTTVYLLLLVLNICTAAVAPQVSPHPVHNLCKRWNHQATYHNGKLYVDGGIEVFTESNDGGGNYTGWILGGYNTYILALDLTRSWDWRTDQDIYNAYPKPVRTPQGNQIPVVQRGALIAGSAPDRSLYLYGGCFSWFNTSFPGATPGLAADNSLFSFDPTTLAWGSITSQRMFGYLAQIPNAGASAEAPDQGRAFYIGGQIDNGTTFDKVGLGGSSIALGGMIVINTINKTATNYSTTSLGPPRTRGEAVYVPNIGLAGALIYLGGLFQGAQNGSEYKKENMVSFKTIPILDINLLSQDPSNLDPIWYQQNATGQVPPPRADFCMFTTSAADNSSHQIYIYGGQDGATVFDDMYVLTLPSFTWFRIFEGASPRMHHTCHVAAGNQVITLGGISAEPGTPWFWSTCDWEYQATGIFNLNTESWGSAFNASMTPYQVSHNLSSFIGGNAYGNATVKAPSRGFTDPRLARLFTQKRLANSTISGSGAGTDDRNSSMTRSAFIGIVAGSILGGSIVLGLLSFVVYRYFLDPCMSRHRRARHPTTSGTTVPSARTYSLPSSPPNTIERIYSWSQAIIPTARNGGSSVNDKTSDFELGDHSQISLSREGPKNTRRDEDAYHV